MTISNQLARFGTLTIAAALTVQPIAGAAQSLIIARPAPVAPVQAPPVAVAPAPAAPSRSRPLQGVPVQRFAPANTLTLPANTPITVKMNESLSSKQAKVGDTFYLSVVSDVIHNGYIIIPRGSRAVGQVSYRNNKGAFGKSGKMEVEVNGIDIDGNRIATTGKFRQEGEGNTVATVGAVIVAGVFAAFVTGKSALIPAGRELSIYTRDPITVSLGR